MILEINAFHQVNSRKLMDIYGESNRENTSYFYPEIADINEALAKVECDYLHYIETDFLANHQNRYIILDHDGIWVCGLRLCQIDDSLYYIEALETHPEHRNKGYCAELLSGVIDRLKQRGQYTIRDCVGKENMVSLQIHQKVGFVIYSDTGYDYLHNEIDPGSYGLQFTFEG